MGKGRGPGIKELLIPTNTNEDPTNSTTQWTVEENKEKLTRSIMKQNEKQFSKAFNTPYECGSLKEPLGADGTPAAGDAMLRGAYGITSPITELKEFVETFKSNPKLQDIKPEITPKMFAKAFGRVH
jgi:hypothetical protein